MYVSLDVPQAGQLGGAQSDVENLLGRSLAVHSQRRPGSLSQLGLQLHDNVSASGLVLYLLMQSAGAHLETLPIEQLYNPHQRVAVKISNTPMA